MKNKIKALLVGILLTTIVFAQSEAKTAIVDRNKLVNVIFPLVEAKTLLNNKIVFPTVAKNKIVIVCVAFNDDGRPKSDTWVKEVATKYADTNIVFYEIPMIKNAPKMFRGAIEKGMRKGTDVKLHNNVANYYGTIKEYKKTLLMDDEDSCYTFLLDKNGTIQFSTEGKTTPENLKQLDDAIKLLTK
jgi:hypothetical protein